MKINYNVLIIVIICLVIFAEIIYYTIVGVSNLTVEGKKWEGSCRICDVDIEEGGSLKKRDTLITWSEFKNE